ncbi:hypothetical protein FA15DRAFT_623047 [Coprinopsis marcescibilis]|uniref:UvrD-like helicase ATP-binding domain-containing protein n=1 Tax=Coprinopsis marcescibilis TaxID=230819 RepID=A0A5C3KQG3_COPMA|nr:hypothetical protein FA15DRAFT_623047 [Coprinopsis marcescibilis]
MVLGVSTDLSLERSVASAFSRFELTVHSVENVREALLELDTKILFQFSEKSILNHLLTTTEPSRFILEAILSCGSWSTLLGMWLTDKFPTTRASFIDSLHEAVIKRLSLCFHFLPIPFDRDQLAAISEYRVSADLTAQVLRVLDKVTFDQDEEAEEAEFGDGFAVGIKRKQSQRKKQARKAQRQGMTLNPLDFEKLDIPIPQSQRDVEDISVLLLQDMNNNLKDLLLMLRKEVVSQTIQGTCVKQRPVLQDPSNTETVSMKSPTDSESPAEPSLPAAYPMVQPMRAALYFESAQGLGDWRILISTRADRDLRDWRRRDADMFKIIIKKIKELSQGMFSKDNQKRLNKDDVDFPIFEAKMTGDTRLVYQIDCVPEYDSQHERQVIKIFGVYTHAQIDKRFWDSMGYQLSKKGKQYRERCKFRNRPHDIGDYVVSPASFPPQAKEEKDALIIPELPKEDLEEIHSLLVLEKFVMLSQELLNSILADLDVAHVFNVTPQEKEIIEHPYSCYVLGRSGTGKTTTMLFKMLGIERAFGMQNDPTVVKPRQIFVTQSRVLATRVEEYFAKLLESLEAAKKSRKELKTIAKEKKTQQDDNNSGLYDVDDDVTWKAGLPHRYSLLKDEHFPLFLTFERLVQLLEGDIMNLEPEGKSPTGKGQIITYEAFAECYWPHFPQNLTKGLDSSLVFSEMLGVMEGSELSLSQEDRRLDQDTYSNLSHRTQHVFAKQRDTVFAIFQAYIKLKRLNEEYDNADRTHRILKAFDCIGVPGTKIDYLYVDEAQDNLLIDAMLLRSICKNPNGLFWAGDTAQTIAIGSSFRFDDLKAFLYRLEKRREKGLADNQKGIQSDLRTFQLAINYRSHGGIVRCAHSVIELITTFWPYAIDSMTPEEGIVDGTKPVLFSGWDTNTVRYEQFLFGDSGDRIEFGARQCILVRDETARAELRKQVGDIGLILTLYESKGLEFDDVLLYKFFEDSSVDLAQWRVVLNLVEGDRKAANTPRFDEARHAGVCSELKFLYVAITRARKNLWIVDCSDKAEPVKTLWTSRGYIQNCTPGTEVPHLAVSSSPEEWEKTGRTLFTNRRYLQAMHSFERAGLKREVKIAHTHYLREEARSIVPSSKEYSVAKRDAFVLAGESFLECASTARGKERRVYFHNAADSFKRAGELFDTPEIFARAARAYEHAQEFNDALRLYYRKCERFDEAVNIVSTHRDKLEPSLVEGFVDVARLFYFKRRDLKKAQMLFNSVEEQLEYLEDNVLLDECHAAVLVELGHYQQAAEIHLAEGRTSEAIQVLLEDASNPDSTRKANTCIVKGLWESVSFAVRIKKDNTKAHQMLELAARLNKDVLSTTEKDEISMFQNIKTLDLKALRLLGHQFLKRKETAQALLCFDHCFGSQNLNTFANLKNSQVCQILADFLAYCTVLRMVASSLDLENSSTQRLFGFHGADAENMYHVPRGTRLYELLDQGRRLVLHHEEDSPILSGQVIQETLKNELWRRMAKRIRHENDLCRRSNLFTPCLPFIINSECRLINCFRQHIPWQELDEDWFNSQVRMYLQQVMIFHTLHYVPHDPMVDRFRTYRFWIHKLFNTLNPPVHYLGSFACIRLDLIPESQKGLEIVRNWCRDVLYFNRHHNASNDTTLLTTIYECVQLCLMIDKFEARKYLDRGPLLRCFQKMPGFYRKSDAGDIYIVPELLLALKGLDRQFLTGGILFLRQVVNGRIALDINHLRHLIEFLSGGVILARVNFNLHNVTLPRTWFISLLQHINRRENVETKLFDQLLASIGQVLSALVHGGEPAASFLFENRGMADVPALRELYIAPICRALGLIGYNINNDNMRANILRMLSPLKTAKPHWTHQIYANVESWYGQGGMGSAVHHSTTDSPLDGLVQLCHESSTPPKQQQLPKNVTRVTFKSVDDVRRALNANPSAATLLSSLRADAPTFVPGGKNTTGPEGRGSNAEGEAEEAGDRPDADTTDVADSQNLVNSIANTAAPLPQEAIPEAQLIIARKILKGYRRLVLQRELQQKRSPVEASCNSIHETCLKLSSNMDWPNGLYYKKLYLGLIPHLLICVNAVQTYVQGAKSKAKKRMLKEEKQDLDDLNKRMNELNAIFKLGKDLHKRLEPHSDLHKCRDLDGLKTAVIEVEELVKRVPSGVSEIRLHLDLSIKAIVKEKPPTKAPVKPDLNVDEDIVDDDDQEVDDYHVYDKILN